MHLVHIVPVPSSRVLTLSKAAQYLSMSRSTLEKYTDLGKLRAYNLMGRRVYKLEDLDSLIEGLKEWLPHQTREGSPEGNQ